MRDRSCGPPSGSTQFVSEDDWGNSADNSQVARIQREQIPARTLPGSLRLSFYDPSRDYQTGEARASASEQQTSEVKRELPAATSASDAKSLVQRMLAIEWARRDRLTLRLPPRYLSLEPGDHLELQLNPGRWSVEKCTIDGFVVVTELLPAWTPTAVILADGGRITANPDIQASPLSLALLDVGSVSAAIFERTDTAPCRLDCRRKLEAPSGEVIIPGQTVAAQTAARKSLLGRALTILPPAEPYLIDTTNSVDIELIDASQWLTELRRRRARRRDKSCGRWKRTHPVRRSDAPRARTISSEPSAAGPRRDGMGELQPCRRRHLLCH